MMDALLNEEGRKIWGAIFKDGTIPVLSPVSHKASLGGVEEEIYDVAWDDLTPVQRGQVINQLAQNFKASTQAVENQILMKGLPLRAKYVSYVPIPGRFF
jgi:hypothetical protein